MNFYASCVLAAFSNMFCIFKVVKMFYPHAQSNFTLHTAATTDGAIGGGSGTNTLATHQNLELRKVYYFQTPNEWEAER